MQHLNRQFTQRNVLVAYSCSRKNQAKTSYVKNLNKLTN